MKIKIAHLALWAASLLAADILMAQTIRNPLKNNKEGQDTTRSSGGGLLNQVARQLPGGGGGRSGLSAAEVAEGLKAALEQGAEKGANKLSMPDGFLGNAAVKILMPPEAQKVEQTLRGAGLGRQVDQAITSMNRAAEDAAKSAAPIFVNAIKQMSIQDAFNILSGAPDAATQYLRRVTTAPLTEAFRPVIGTSLEKVGATRHWNTVFTNYNRFSREQVNTDLNAYVTERALMGIFSQIAEEEANIRRNPGARTSDILKKVFGN